MLQWAVLLQSRILQPAEENIANLCSCRETQRPRKTQNTTTNDTKTKGNTTKCWWNVRVLQQAVLLQSGILQPGEETIAILCSCRAGQDTFFCLPKKNTTTKGNTSWWNARLLQRGVLLQFRVLQPAEETIAVLFQPL